MSSVERVPTEVWERNPDSPEGYMRLVERRLVADVYADVRAIVGEYPEGGEEYLSIAPHRAASDRWPEGQTVVYAVEGSSEGDYVHVDVLNGGSRTGVLLGKTFAGRDAAWSFARRLSDMLANPW